MSRAHAGRLSPDLAGGRVIGAQNGYDLDAVAAQHSTRHHPDTSEDSEAVDQADPLVRPHKGRRSSRQGGVSPDHLILAVSPEGQPFERQPHPHPMDGAEVHFDGIAGSAERQDMNLKSGPLRRPAMS